MLVASLTGFALMTGIWLTAGVNDARGLLDMRVFFLGAVVASGLVTVYSVKNRASIDAIFLRALSTFTLTFGLPLLLLFIAIYVMLSGGGFD